MNKRAYLLVLFLLVATQSTCWAQSPCSPFGLIKSDDNVDYLTNDTGTKYLTSVSSTVGPTNSIVDYLFKFPAQVNAAVDPVIGPLLTTSGFIVWVWPDLTKNSAVADPAFWFMITQLGANLNFSLYAESNLQLVNLRSTNQLFCTNIPTQNIQIIVPNSGGVYTQRGLPATGPLP